MKKFEDLKVWKKAQSFYLDISREFENNKNFFFKDQILKAALSISNNLAEGYERMSDKEFRYFLFVSKGSCGEVRSMLYLSSDLGYIEHNIANELIEKTNEISKMLGGLIKKMNV